MDLAEALQVVSSPEGAEGFSSPLAVVAMRPVIKREELCRIDLIPSWFVPAGPIILGSDRRWSLEPDVVQHPRCFERMGHGTESLPLYLCFSEVREQGMELARVRRWDNESIVDGADHKYRNPRVNAARKKRAMKSKLWFILFPPLRIYPHTHPQQLLRPSLLYPIPIKVSMLESRCCAV